MFQAIVPTVRSAFLAAGLLGLVVAGLAIRGAAPVDAPSLGMADDHGTRHAIVVGSRLTQADDYGTRNQPQLAELTRADDFGTRHAATPAELGPFDDYATRHVQ